MRDIESRYLVRWRKELLGSISGDILEVGAGTGASLQCYHQSSRSKVLLIEPEESMFKYLVVKSLLQGFQAPLQMSSENLLFPNESFDYVVSSMVLCTVRSQKTALDEFTRVLRPEGRLIIFEHILSPNNKCRRRWQCCCKNAWSFVAAGCDPCRRTDLAITQHGFEWQRLDYVDIDVGPEILRSFIYGVALKVTSNNLG